ncbi:TlpA family protein disulfide reductase [Arachidicoccus terrestris]|uniref:TlpA family protein disulfide reductase n=1 Tax=Arachidicoccus terrestris TaxID=2875539 RepID=UPI001CC54066|nr:TlpA disulfide reductase family protein [Arachidicoccus terrestris]UAY56285.1 TlpA family protein disulfide reductase [Arachidicoccus terrestris]
MRINFLLSTCLMPVCCFGLFSIGCDTRTDRVNVHATADQPASVAITLHPDVNKLTKDFKSFWNYWYDSVDLSRNFIALNTDSQQISKKVFLEKLNTGKFMPVNTGINQDQYTYQLIPLPEKIVTDIAGTIRQMAATALWQFEKEGTPLPDFDFTTIEGKNYTNANCKGKILVLDTWFVRCTACVNEMPDLNRWVYPYKDRKDVVFLSLCLDDSAAIEKFLTRQGFAFQIVPDAKAYIEGKLGVFEFPTKILVGKDGKIIKIGNFKSIRRVFNKLLTGPAQPAVTSLR